jgi:hypothetical protein
MSKVAADEKIQLCKHFSSTLPLFGDDVRRHDSL